MARIRRSPAAVLVAGLAASALASSPAGVPGTDCEDQDDRWQAHGSNCSKMSRLCDDPGFGQLVRKWCPRSCGLCPVPVPASADDGSSTDDSNGSSALGSPNVSFDDNTPAPSRGDNVSDRPGSFGPLPSTLWNASQFSTPQPTCPANATVNASQLGSPTTQPTCAAPEPQLPAFMSPLANVTTIDGITEMELEIAFEPREGAHPPAAAEDLLLNALARRARSQQQQPTPAGNASAGNASAVDASRNASWRSANWTHLVNTTPRIEYTEYRLNPITDNAIDLNRNENYSLANLLGLRLRLPEQIITLLNLSGPAAAARTETEEEPERCPDGYERLTGKVHGGDQWTGNRESFADSMEDCGRKCFRTPGCGSFEFSPARKKCFRNTQTRPTSEQSRLDFIFCRRLPCPQHKTKEACIGPDVPAGYYSAEVNMRPGSYCIWSGGACQAPMACSDKDCFLPDGGLPGMDLPPSKTLWISAARLRASLGPAARTLATSLR